MNEFTGERVVPGQVNPDLWNEHISRYALASESAAGARVLDIGSGSGYGSAELAIHATSVVGIDISTDAVRYATASFPTPNLRFVQASAASIPFAAGTFQLITAFEVIEHLQDWRNLIAEARRVLHPSGAFIVSTPNVLYYAESRELEGPNPFHEHEFEYEEFRAALAETFPYVDVLLQNRAECLAFYPVGAFWPSSAHLHATAGSPAHANFFVAICTLQPRPNRRSFVYVPKAVNILREREQHIAKLNSELALKQQWLADTRAERDAVITAHAAQKTHLEEQNRWAQGLERDLHAAQARILELQRQFAAEQQAAREVAQSYEAKVAELEEDARQKAQWAIDTEQRLTAEIAHDRAQAAAIIQRLEDTEATLEERTRFAMSQRNRVEKLESQLNAVRASRWFALGRKLGVGPQV